MSSVDNRRHVSSYDIGAKPFRHDQHRGKWSSRADFYFASLCQGFGWEALCDIPVYIFFIGGGFSLLSFFLSVFFVGIPIFFIQSYLGQFSSTGLISSFRIVPLFKGIGYVIVIFNIISLAYYGAFAAVPLLYFVRSFETIPPWMSCNNTWNSPNCSLRNDYDFVDDTVNPHATVEFFHYKVRGLEDGRGPFSLSLLLCGCIAIIWLIVSLVFIQNVELIGKFFRISTVILITSFMAVFIRMLCLSELRDILSNFSFEIPELHYLHPHVGANLVMLFFRPGWGNTIALASHNTFKTDIMKMSFMVCLSGFGMILIAVICGRIVWDHFEDHVGGLHYHIDEEHSLQFIYLCYAFFLGELPYANIWSGLFFGALCLVEFNKLLILLLSAQTAICDEFEILRPKKNLIKISLVGTMALVSLYFATQQGFQFLSILDFGATFSQAFVFLLIILIVLWLYGKLRFQRDAQFMIGRTMSDWMIFILRYVAPFIICFPMFIAEVQLSYHNDVSVAIAFIMKSIPWMVIPIYILYTLSKSRRRSVMARIRECIQPSDWYPADVGDCRRYERAIGLPDHAHQLLEIHLDTDQQL